MDRFTVRLTVGYPRPKDEREMVLSRQGGVNPLEQVEQVVTRTQLVQLQQQAARVYVKDELVSYIVALITATRKHPMLRRGASPRATLAVTSMAKAAAFLKGRDYVLPDDVQTVWSGTVAHRLLLSADAESRGLSETAVLAEILQNVNPPRL